MSRRHLTVFGPPFGRGFTLNRASPQAVGLVSWWPLLTTRGGPIEDRAGVNTGTPSGAVGPIATEVMGVALNFPGGGSDYVALANQDFTHITATAWIRNSTSNNGGFNHIISRHPNWFLSHDGASGIRFNINGAAEAFCVTDYTLINNQWALIAATYDRQNIIGYLNGVQTGSPTAYTTAIGASGTQRLGAYGGGGFNWVGQMADVRLYNRALSAAEIWQLYAPQTRWELYQPVPLTRPTIIAVPRHRLPLLGVG